jgi:signal transduction histidine kinase
MPPDVRRRGGLRRLLPRDHWLDAAWGLFTVLNLAAMVRFGTWETIAFQFIWVGGTLLYGLRVWRRLLALQRLQSVLRTNERLAQRQRKFIQDASHELRTPIAVSLGHVELIARSATGSLRDDARVAVDELMRLRRLSDRLLVLAAAEDPDFLHWMQVDVEPILVETLRRWGPLPRQWRLGLVEEAQVQADPDRLGVAIDALVENAVKFSTRGDVIELSALRTDAEVSIRVSDGGPGIPAQDLERVFERFSRLREGRGGLGLGLAIVRAIVEAHGGSVHARSTVGQGSTFELRLPLAVQSAGGCERGLSPV